MHTVAVDTLRPPLTDAVETIAVVIVEDDDRLARLTARYLESHGVVVNIAGDGRDGIAKVMQHRLMMTTLISTTKFHFR